jgi:hypothetical protein
MQFRPQGYKGVTLRQEAFRCRFLPRPFSKQKNKQKSEMASEQNDDSHPHTFLMFLGVSTRCTQNKQKGK